VEPFEICSLAARCGAMAAVVAESWGLVPPSLALAAIQVGLASPLEELV